MASKDQDGNAAVYVRIDQRCKDWIRKYAHDNPQFTEKLIVENLIKYVMSLPAVQQNDVLSGVQGSLTGVGTAIELLEWSEHAFSNKFWEWALEEFHGLEEFARDASGLKRIAHYKQSYCYIEIAMALRKEALLNTGNLIGQGKFNLKQYDDSMRAADRALYLSLIHIKYFMNLEYKHPIVIFNRACVWSLRAQYTVERSLAWRADERGTPWKKGMLSSLARSVQSQDKSTKGEGEPSPKTEEDCWKEIGRDWHVKLSKEPEGELLIEKVTSYADCAMESLRAIKDVDEEGRGLFRSKRGFVVRHSEIVRRSEEDPDLRFLRSDARVSGEFYEWASQYKDVSRLKTFNMLWKELPQDVRDMREPV